MSLQVSIAIEVSAIWLWATTSILFHCAEIVDGTREIEVGASVGFVVAHRFGNLEASEIIKL